VTEREASGLHLLAMHAELALRWDASCQGASLPLIWLPPHGLVRNFPAPGLSQWRTDEQTHRGSRILFDHEFIEAWLAWWWVSCSKPRSRIRRKVGPLAEAVAGWTGEASASCRRVRLPSPRLTWNWSGQAPAVARWPRAAKRWPRSAAALFSFSARVR